MTLRAAGTGLALAAVLLLGLPAAAQGSRTGGKRTLARPHTIARVSGFVNGFAQDGPRIAWTTQAGGARHCVRTLHVRTLAAGRRFLTRQRGCLPSTEEPTMVALAGRAAVWQNLAAGGNAERDIEVWTAVAGAHAHKLERLHLRFDPAEGAPTLPTAGAGRLLVYDSERGGAGSIRRIVGGRARTLFAFASPIALADDGGRIAVVRQEVRPGDGCGCVSSPDWRSDGKIGFLSRRPSSPAEGKADIVLIDRSGSGQTQLTDDDVWRNTLDWSQDGTKLTYDHNLMIAVAAADGSGAHDVEFGEEPSLSPDGSKIAFARWVGTYVIYVANAGGSGERVIAGGVDPAWSPDGTRVAYTENGALSVINADGSEYHRLGSLTGFDPDWSPDGTKLAYSNGGICVASADGTNEHCLTTGPDFDPHWSPDGRTIVFVSRRNDVLGRGAQELYLIDADGSHLRPLTFSEPARAVTSGQVRSAAGRLLSSFEVDGRAVGVALARGAVVVLTTDASGQGSVTVFDAATGARRRTAAFPGDLPVMGGANSRWVVFRTNYRTIRALDLRTMKTRTLAVARTTPVGLSVSGRRVAWAENAANGKSARIRALVLPR
jgi:Tol biopolymer transport system component